MTMNSIRNNLDIRVLDKAKNPYEDLPIKQQTAMEGRNIERAVGKLSTL